MIYNKGVATILGTASASSLVSRPGGPAARCSLCWRRSGVGATGEGFWCSHSDRSGSEMCRFTQSCCTTRRKRLLLGRPPGHTAPALVRLVWDFRRGFV